MERQTRQLLGALADELTDDLLAALVEGAALETELQRRTGFSRQTVFRRLEALEGLGLVTAQRQRTPGRGRPTRRWSLADPQIAEFIAAADRLRLSLVEAQAERLREAIRPELEVGNVRELRP